MRQYFNATFRLTNIIQYNIKQTPANSEITFSSLGQTPERIEFENVEALSDGEPSLQNIIDENEWTDRNFGTGTEESESDSDTYSSDTDTDSADSEEYEEAEGSPLDAHTLKLANDWIGQQRYSSNDEDEFYDSSDGMSS